MPRTRGAVWCRKTLSLCEVLIFFNCGLLSFFGVDYLYFLLVLCCVCVPVDRSGFTSPLMSRRAQPARDCKKAKSVSSSDTVFSSESGITGGSSTQSVIGVSNPVGDSCSISGSCVISSPHGISFCSSRSSLSSEGTLTGRMEDDYQEEQSLEDRELGAGRVLPSSGDSQVDVLLDSLLARLNSGLRRRYGNEPDRVPIGGGASGGVDKN